MRSLAHISDLHFGRIDPTVVAGLAADLAARRPDVIVISGDLTQRAKHHQFEAARDFLDQLTSPFLVIPGNHDVSPMWRPVGRLLDPLRRYRLYISPVLNPVWHDDEIAVVGVNTARGHRWKEGRISSRQVSWLRRTLGALQTVPFKVVFTHHPFVPPPDAPDTSIVGEAGRALAVMEVLNVDLLLAGHLHRGYWGDVSTHHTALKRSMLVAQAATATSTRLRDEPNAYNWIEIAPGRVDLLVRVWQDGAFANAKREVYVKPGERWQLERVEGTTGAGAEVPLAATP